MALQNREPKRLGCDFFLQLKCSKWSSDCCHFTIRTRNGNWRLGSWERLHQSCYAQTENPYVVFSPKFENIANSNYLESKKEYKNVALVAGEGEGAERKTTSVGEGSGLERRELFVDARDISTTTEDNVTLSDEEYKKQLAQRGDEKLAESVAAQSFEGQVEMTKMFEYGKDFFIGDIVQIANEYGMESRARISEIVTAIDTQGTVTYPTLSTVT